MTTYRKSMKFDPHEAGDNLLMGICGLGVTLVFLILLLRVERRTFFDWVFCFIFGALLLSLCWYIFKGIILGGVEGQRINQRWRKKVICVETEIIDRDESHYPDNGYRAEYSEYTLVLRLVADQQIVCPGETTVLATVSQGVFQRYTYKKMARIYYIAADPLAFFIEGEL